MINAVPRAVTTSSVSADALSVSGVKPSWTRSNTDKVSSTHCELCATPSAVINESPKSKQTNLPPKASTECTCGPAAVRRRGCTSRSGKLPPAARPLAVSNDPSKRTNSAHAGDIEESPRCTPKRHSSRNCSLSCDSKAALTAAPSSWQSLRATRAHTHALKKPGASLSCFDKQSPTRCVIAESSFAARAGCCRNGGGVRASSALEAPPSMSCLRGPSSGLSPSRTTS